MDKSEFLNILRQSLEGEVRPDIIEQNIRYYDQYIGSNQAENEQEILESLGDPRLIAKTIIEAERASHRPGTYADEEYSNHYGQADYDNSYQKGFFNKTNSPFHVYGNLKWYHYGILILLLIVALVLIFAIGGFLIYILLSFGLPILLIFFLYQLFRNRRK